MKVVKNWSPPAHRPRTPYTRALVGLGVGDALRITGGEPERNNLSALASQWGKRLGRTFRTTVDKGHIVVWREA